MRGGGQLVCMMKKVAVRMAVLRASASGRQFLTFHLPLFLQHYMHFRNSVLGQAKSMAHNINAMTFSGQYITSNFSALQTAFRCSFLIGGCKFMFLNDIKKMITL